MRGLTPNSIPGPLAILALASVFTVSAGAQQAPPASTQATPPATAQSQPATPQDNTAVPPSQTEQPSPDVNQQRLSNKSKEGFWGHMQPFARKKWVHRQTDPINDRLTELDQLNAKNAQDIKDVDARAQAGIRQAQSTADAANQVATQAGSQAQNANTVAQGATGRVDQINTTVSGLDQYRPVTEADIAFRAGSSVLSKADKDKLDQLVQNVTGHQGFIIEVEAHAPGRGVVGIQSSQRLAEVVNRYFVEHDIPVYRLHAVALGNAPMMASAQTPNAQGTNPATTSEDQDNKPVRTRTVHVRVMENSLAARGAASPQGAAPSNGAERP